MKSVHLGVCERGNRVLKRVLCVLLSFAFVAAFCGLLLRFDTTGLQVRNVVLCSWARHFTTIVPPLVPANLKG